MEAVLWAFVIIVPLFIWLLSLPWWHERGHRLTKTDIAKAADAALIDAGAAALKRGRKLRDRLTETAKRIDRKSRED